MVIMLRITKIKETSKTIQLKLEGKVTGDWVSVLENECSHCLAGNRQVQLDFSDVTFVEGRVGDTLNLLMSQNVKIVNCSTLVRELLKGRKGDD